jgi:precorrin-6B methylase 2
MKAKSVIGVGARIGAMTAATHFARPEFHVTALEKNTRAAPPQPAYAKRK